jgi:hypothetical protein
MILSNELQIGDWVKVNDSLTINNSGNPITDKLNKFHYDKIKTIEENCVAVGTGIVYYSDELYKISITKELLLYNGFKYDDTYIYKYSDEDITYIINYNLLGHKVRISKIEKFKDNSRNHSYICIRADYVHQLQHILNLFNINFEIKLDET